jgi:hypothetical protein
VVWGDDPLAAVKIQQKQLRLQLEREVKTKLFQLREAYLASEGRGRHLTILASQSLTAFLSIFHGILYLRDKEIPQDKVDLIKAIADETGLATEPFVQLLGVKEGRVKARSKAIRGLIEGYIEEVMRLALWIDKI